MYMRFPASLIVATAVVTGNSHLDAQVPLQSKTVRRIALPASGTMGLSGSFWRAVLGNGGPMPGFERLVVIASDGSILGEANGDENQVLLPETLARMLSDGAVRATLVHNHPAGVSLSGTDLGQLGKPGVDRVIAVSPDGSVFEASAGTRFDVCTFKALYTGMLAEVTERVNREAQRDGVDLARLYPNLTHLVALALDRAGVIRYRMTPSLKLRVELDRYRHVLEWTVDSRH
jgi:hypothetical protein